MSTPSTRRCLLTRCMLVRGRGRGRSQTRDVGVDEQVYELCEGQARFPAQPLTRLRRVADEVVQLRGSPLKRRVDTHVLLPVESDVPEGELDDVPHRMALAGCDDVVAGLVLLQHQPHRT